MNATLFCAAWLTTMAWGGAAATDAKPNIILVLTDDWRWDALGCLGTPVVETPQIDRLARTGVLFSNMF